MAGPLGNRFQTRSLMNMSGSQDAAVKAFLEQEELKRQREAMFAEKRALGDPVVVEAFRNPLASRLGGDPKHKPGESPVEVFNRGFRNRNAPVLEKNLSKAKAPVNSLLSLIQGVRPQQSDEFGQSNAAFFQNPRFNPQTGRGGPPSQRYGVPQRVRGLGTGSEMHKPADPRGQQVGQLQVMDEEEDEFMSHDDQMFLLALIEGMQGGKPPTPYGHAVGGGNKAWATLPFPGMS